jgi:hypothetical protein
LGGEHVTINNRGISAEIHQWEEGGRVEVKAYDSDSRGDPRRVRIKVWMDHRPGEVVKGCGALNMTHYDINIPEDTAVAILQQLARMYPTACAEALGYEEYPDVSC